MDGDFLTIAVNVAVLALLISGVVLLLAVTVVVLKCYPSILLIVGNVRKITESTSVAAENVSVISNCFADRSDSIAENIAMAAEKGRDTMTNSAEASANISRATSCFADRSDSIAENIAVAAEKGRDTMTNSAEASANISRATSLLGPAGAVANYGRSIQTGILSLLTGEQKQRLVAKIKEELSSLDVVDVVDNFTKRVRGFWRARGR